MNKVKPFEIEKRLVYEAYQSVCSNKGSSGVDGVMMDDYILNMSRNLYKLWNRMSSGSYFPSPVKLVEIPKSNGGMRQLGIPTIEDRIAQMTVVLLLQKRLDPLFHDDSTAIVPTSPLMTLSPKRVSVAFRIVGYWTWTSASSLTPSIMNC